MVQQLTALKNTMTQLQTELVNTFGVTSRWVGPGQRSFRLNTSDITPTLEKMQNVTVKVVTVKLSVRRNHRRAHNRQSRRELRDVPGATIFVLDAGDRRRGGSGLSQNQTTERARTLRVKPW